MSALANRIGLRPGTKMATKPVEESATVYDDAAVGMRILFVASDDERLYGALSYSGSQAEALRRVAAARVPLPEAARPIE